MPSCILYVVGVAAIMGHSHSEPRHPHNHFSPPTPLFDDVIITQTSNGFGGPPPPPPPGMFMGNPPPPPPPSTYDTILQTQNNFLVGPTPPGRLVPTEEDNFNISKYAYDNTGVMAWEVYRLVHRPSEEFLRIHFWAMLESPTAKAIAEFMDKITYAKNYSGEACLGNREEDALKDYRKRQSKVVFDCEAGWQLNADIETKVQALMKTIDELDNQAREKLKDCKPGQYCYDEFKQSTLTASIDKQLSEIRKDQLVDIKVLTDQSYVLSLVQLHKCNADNSDSLRKDVYTSIANMNVCLANIGLLPNMSK